MNGSEYIYDVAWERQAVILTVEGCWFGSEGETVSLA